MKRHAKFDVPEEVFSDFIRETSNRGFEAKTGRLNRNGEYPVTVEYDREQDEDVSELEDVLSDLISDAEEEGGED